MADVVVAANGTDDDQAAATASDVTARRPSEPVDVYPRLLMAARCGNSEELEDLLLRWNRNADVEAGSASHLPRVTMERDTLLHVVAGSHLPIDAGQQQQKLHRCVDVIICDIQEKGGAAAVRQALEARNNKGDTPLHCAAGAGNSYMITCLVDLVANSRNVDEDEAELKKGFVSMQNDCGETALHHAVRAPHNNKTCIDKLMEHDPDLARVLHKDGTSPLYLAISLGKFKIAEHLYDLYSESNKGSKLSYSGPDGRNVLHAAVSRGEGLRMILEWLEDVKKTMSSGSSVAAEPADLLSQLTSQRDRQQKGSTPLHLAASLEGLTPTELLLKANESTAYQADDEGSYPIHAAARSGRLLTVKTLLLERCPDCATLRDGKGRTFLHVAAEKSYYNVVRYAVWGDRGMPQHLSRMMTTILNAQDSNGDTALHIAVCAGKLGVFNCLFRNGQVRLDVANQDGMTPLDLSFTKIPAGFNYGLNPRNIVCTSLLAAGAPHGGYRSDLFSEKHMPKRDVDKESTKHTEATQVMGVVTALVATVTFASAFTLPGGYRAADAGAAAGTPVLAGRYAFDAFVLADTLAFVCSIAATCTLVYAGLPAIDISQRNWYFNVSAFLLQSASRSLVAAFGLGLYLVLAPVDLTMAVAVCMIIFATSLYGNMATWRIICMATMVLARIGLLRAPRALVVTWARSIFMHVMLHFGSYVIIFGLPAIRRWVIPGNHKWQ